MLKNQSRTNLILLIGDLLVFFGALVLTLLIRYQEVPSEEVLMVHVLPFSLLFALWAATFLIAGLYDRFVSFNRRGLPKLVLRVQVINMLLAAVLFFALPLGITPKTNLVIYLIVSTVLILGWRLFIYPLLVTKQRILTVVIGSGDEADGVATVLNRNPYYGSIEVIKYDSREYKSSEDLCDALTENVVNRDISLFVVDMENEYIDDLIPFFFNLNLLGHKLPLFSLNDFYEKIHHRIPLSLLRQSWLLENISPQSPHYAYDAMKRLIDIVGAVLLLLPCLIIFPIVILLIKLQDGGAVFYRTERVGLYNQLFTIIKFRTMNGTDQGSAALNSTLTVTKLGTVLRRLRVDELPQIINVLMGDLSFIGPRPEMPALAAKYAESIPYYNMRHLVKPGLSGWAQINNYDVPRGGIDVERTTEKLSFDFYYLKNRSLLLDIEIVLKTINTVLSRTGT